MGDLPRRRPDVETHILPDGTCLLFDPVASEGHALNALGALVWDYCDGTVDRDEMVAQIASLVPDSMQVPAEIHQLLNQFEHLGLLLMHDAAGAGYSAH